MPKYLVGVVCPEFVDQPYIRDRDLEIEADYEHQAVRKFIDEYKHFWLRSDEYHLVKVIRKIE